MFDGFHSFHSSYIRFQTNKSNFGGSSNTRTTVNPSWLDHLPRIRVQGLNLKLIPRVTELERRYKSVLSTPKCAVYHYTCYFQLIHQCCCMTKIHGRIFRGNGLVIGFLRNIFRSAGLPPRNRMIFGETTCQNNPTFSRNACIFGKLTETKMGQRFRILFQKFRTMVYGSFDETIINDS